MPRRTACALPTERTEEQVVTQIENYDQVDVFVGLDVGKGEHHAVALDRTGKKLYDKALPNDELLIVDQPKTIGALPVAVAQAAGAVVGYLPGLAMRRIADLQHRWSFRGSRRYGNSEMMSRRKSRGWSRLTLFTPS